MKRIIFSLSIVFFAFSLFAQDSNYVRKVICSLSSDEMHGRWIPHNGDSIAAQFIKTELIRNNINPLKDDYFQYFYPNGYAMEGKVIIKVDGVDLQMFEEVRIPFSAPSTNGIFPIIKADITLLDYDKDSYNIPLKQWEKLKKKFGDQLNESFIYFDTRKIEKLDKESQSRIKENLNRLKKDKDNRYGFKGILIGSSELPGFGPGYSGKRNFTLLYLLPELINNKTKNIEIRFTNHVLKHKTQNILAMVRGTVQPDSFIVFSAHYDHVGQLGDDYIFHGAHDNASGTAFVLDIARHIQQKPLYYSTIFLFTSGEESGLLGSSYFVENPLIDLSRIVQEINFDLSCGGNDGVMIVNAKDTLNQKYVDAVVTLNEEKNYMKEIKFRSNAPNSDHYPFAIKGIPAIFIYTLGGFTAQVHHTSDTCENCHLDVYNNLFTLFINPLYSFRK